MATVTVKNLPEDVRRALRMRAAVHGRSIEAEIRHILETMVRPPERLQLSTALAVVLLNTNVVSELRRPARTHPSVDRWAGPTRECVTAL